MTWLKTLFHECIGLFVDDGSFAIAIVLWLALLGLVLPSLRVPGSWRAAILFVGLVAILVESVTRRARRTGRRL